MKDGSTSGICVNKSIWTTRCSFLILFAMISIHRITIYDEFVWLNFSMLSPTPGHRKQKPTLCGSLYLRLIYFSLTICRMFAPIFCHFPEEKISVSILGTCKLIHVYIYNAHCVFIEMNDKGRQEKSISAGIVLYQWFQKLDKFLKISISPSRYLTF